MKDDDYNSPAKQLHRSHVAGAHKHYKTFFSPSAKLLLVDTKSFDGSRHMIYEEGISASDIIAVNKKGALTIPEDVAGITFIGRDVYDLRSCELDGVAVAWLDTCQTGISRHGTEFSTSLAAFARVPYVCEVHTIFRSFFMNGEGKRMVDIMYKDRHEKGERKAFHTRIDPYYGRRSSMIFVSSYLKREYAIEPVYMSTPSKRSVAPASPADESEAEHSDDLFDSEEESDSEPEILRKKAREAPKRSTKYDYVLGRWMPRMGAAVQVTWEIKGRATRMTFNGIVTRVDSRGYTILYPDEEFLHRRGKTTCLSLYPWIVVGA